MAVFTSMGLPRNIINGFNLTLSDCSCVRISDNWYGKDIVSPFSRLYYVKKGGGVLIYNGEEIALEDDHIYLIPVGTKYSYYLKGYIEKAYFHFGIASPDGYDILKNIRKILSIPCDPSHITEIYRLYESPLLIDGLTLKSYIFSDVIKMVTSTTQVRQEQEYYSEKIYKAMQIISASPNLQITVNDVARSLLISESYLAKKFKKEVGTTLNHYIDEMILYRAQIDLIETEYSIAQISEKYGFRDIYYFSKWFKKFHGESPLQYRKRLKINPHK